MAEIFNSYDEYMRSVFDCVNRALNAHLEGMKQVFASGQGGFKNVLYPDLEVASDVTRDKMISFDRYADGKVKEAGGGEEESSPTEDAMDIDDELFGLLGAFSFDESTVNDTAHTEKAPAGSPDSALPARERIERIRKMANASIAEGIALPFHTLCTKREFEDFSYFCFACAILSSTQTEYAGVFQIINENSGLSCPTIESAAKLYYGADFSITAAYGDMSACL